MIIAIGLLSEYIKSEEYDKMELVIGVARGVAYLHCELCLVFPNPPSQHLYLLPQQKELFIRIYEGYVQPRVIVIV